MLLSAIKHHASSRPDDVALVGDDVCLNWSQFEQQVMTWQRYLTRYQNKVVAMYLDNSPIWAVIDVACQLAGAIVLPIPAFFSDQQIAHALYEAGADRVIHNKGDRLSGMRIVTDSGEIKEGLMFSPTRCESVTLPKNTSKITFTSGTTGQPKGVCLSLEHQWQVAEALVKTVGLTSVRHLSVLPFSTLLENIAGIYAPIISGGCIVALPLEKLGFDGCAEFDVMRLMKTMACYQPNSIILLPELLMALLHVIEQGAVLTASLAFIAVGGSKVSSHLLSRARLLGLPVFEGYGLSECGSVVALNTPSAQRLGSVGRPLSHLNISIESNELVVSGQSFLGYVSDPDSWYQEKIYTGDIACVDDDGYLYIDGRINNTLITSFGRNINPEWPESELLATGLFRQVVVFGDAKPFCIAVLVVRNAELSRTTITHAIARINRELPSYVQIKQWHLCDTVMSVANGLYTANGRPVRPLIYSQFQSQIEQLYQEA